MDSLCYTWAPPHVATGAHEMTQYLQSVYMQYSYKESSHLFILCGQTFFSIYRTFIACFISAHIWR